MDRRTGGPPDDLSGERIDGDREGEPPLPGSDVRDVRRPGRVALRRRELALEQVRSQHRRLADLPAARAIAAQRPPPADRGTRMALRRFPSVMSQKFVDKSV